MARLRPRHPLQPPTVERVTRKARIWQYIRLILASGLIGIAFGYYLQVIGALRMDGFLLFSFASRAMIIGAFFWTFEVFYATAPAGAGLRARPRGTRLAIRMAAYFVLFETGFGVGWVLFNPRQALDFLTQGAARLGAM